MVQMTAVGPGDAEAAYIERVRAFAPSLGAGAAATARRGRLDPDSLAEMTRIGVLRAHVPAAFGGLQLPYAALVDAAMDLSRYCPATGWVTGVTSSGSWRVAKCRPETQAAIWGQGPDVMIAGAFASVGPTVTRSKGGWTVSGRWLFCSGVHHAQWIGLVLPMTDEAGAPISQFGFVPRDAVSVLPSWKSIGMSATGSDDVVLDAVFIPDGMVTPYAEVDSIQAPGQAGHDTAAYRLALTSVFAYSVAGPMVGAAQGALSAYLAKPPVRKMDEGQPQASQATQLRLAESAAEIHAARALCEADMAMARRSADTGAPLGAGDKARMFRNATYVSILCRRATTRLIESLGAQGQDPDHPVRRFHADVSAAAAHAVLNWDMAGAVYARHALGAPEDVA